LLWGSVIRWKDFQVGLLLFVCIYIPYLAWNREFFYPANPYYQLFHSISKNQPISEREVEDYVIELNQKFRFRQVSIDQWHSQSSIIKLKSRGVNIVERQFNKEYKEKIYTELTQLVREDRIDVYDISNGKYIDASGQEQHLNEIQEAKTQFLFLQKKWKGKRYYIESLSGYKDDICDAIAAVSYECTTNKILQRLPSSKMVRFNRR
jgi:hypothetical protein